MNRKRFIGTWVFVLLLSGCTLTQENRFSFQHNITPKNKTNRALQKSKVESLTDSEEERMADFISKVAKIGVGMYPNEVRSILGEPDLVDKEIDIHIDGQDTVWTYEHPIVGCARFLVIFRDGKTEFSSMVVKDTVGRKHYLTLKEFGQ